MNTGLPKTRLTFFDFSDFVYSKPSTLRPNSPTLEQQVDLESKRRSLENQTSIVDSQNSFSDTIKPPVVRPVKQVERKKKNVVV